MEGSKLEQKDMAVKPLRSFRKKKWAKINRSVAGLFGISVSYHRNLAHRSFNLPKWLEYLFAYCGVHALQGDPIGWVKIHRCHHRFVDTEKDPHSPIQGFLFSHVTWLLDSYVLTEKVGPKYFDDYEKIERNVVMVNMKQGRPENNVGDLEKQAFYRFLRKTYFLHLLLLAVLLYAMGGVPFLIWGMVK
uniref:Fatty acid desaturase domain-containing protein n=1 Tax=Cucumis sativus TaxID=3659 RepID=A0A0A0KTF2_CUCSA